MDKRNEKWWTFPKWTEEFEHGIDKYIEHTFASKSLGDEICCPCEMCHYRYWHRSEVIKEHVICNGFAPRSDILSEVRMDNEQENVIVDSDVSFDMNDGIEGLLKDTFREGPNEDAKNFFKLVEEGQQELYAGCKIFSKLSFTIRLFIYKCDYKLCNVAFGALLEIFKDALPKDAKLPCSFNEAKNSLKVLGLDYTKIGACPNDCMLYWEENENATSCKVCSTSRWKSKDTNHEDEKTHKVSAKILRYFPIKKRLQRLFMCQETARYMTWHANGRENDGLLQHPVDGQAWKDFDKSYPMFAQEPRNVRLGLATDGFNPFHTMSIVHSTWPVIMINYNLPPWMLMKHEFLMLALLIPGPLSPGNDIDIYLQPLIKDLKDLWEFVLETYDASTNERFDMRAALVSTVSDFPAYAMLSGWSTKGKAACPCCHYDTKSKWLDHSRKHCYRDFRTFLELSHPWRHDKRKFDGHVEDRTAPLRLTGIEIEELLRDFPHEFGKKKRKKPDEDVPWRKLPIFFKLPYWKDCTHRHNLDVMHIEKNIFDNIIGTLLDIPNKTKDHVSARRDLKKLNIMPELQPIQLEDGGEEIPRSSFWMTLEKKRLFCQTIKNAKLPQGYASNIGRCVQLNEGRIIGYKSHDAHFCMHYLLPIALKVALPKDVSTPLIRLCHFFKGIWNKAIDPCDLDNLHSEIVESLCHLERIFPPAFFTIMVHLPVHLVEEIRLGGPVSSRCMYEIERYLHELKDDVRNKACPEGSMAEAYWAKECLRFCARYLNRSKSPSNGANHSNPQQFLPKIGKPTRGRGKSTKKSQYGFMIDHKTLAQAHIYVIFNCHNEDVERYITEHLESLNSHKKRKWDNAQNHSKDFTEWFKQRVASEQAGSNGYQKGLLMLPKGTPGTLLMVITSTP